MVGAELLLRSAAVQPALPVGVAHDTEGGVGHGQVERAKGRASADGSGSGSGSVPSLPRTFCSCVNISQPRGPCVLAGKRPGHQASASAVLPTSLVTRCSQWGLRVTRRVWKLPPRGPVSQIVGTVATAPLGTPLSSSVPGSHSVCPLTLACWGWVLRSRASLPRL